MFLYATDGMPGSGISIFKDHIDGLVRTVVIELLQSCTERQYIAYMSY